MTLQKWRKHDLSTNKKSSFCLPFLANFYSSKCRDHSHRSRPLWRLKNHHPVGDYVAVPFGNTIWVGTVEEWMDIKADSVMRENGAKRVTLPGDKKNERSYVDSEAKSVSVGKTKLYSITTNIVFGVKPSKKDKRPPKPKGAEYVIIVWVPSEAVSIKAAIAIGNQT